MRNIVADEYYDSSQLEGEYLTEEHYDELINDSCKVFHKGELAFVVIKNAMPIETIKGAWPIIKKIRLVTENRGMASGGWAIILIVSTTK